MMGGSISHEFMLLDDIGEDTLAICPSCSYRANMEAAEVLTHNESKGETELKKAATPDCSTIDALVDFFGTDKKSLCKAVAYQRNDDDSYVVVFIRGDLEVNETKLRNLIGSEIHPAVIDADSGIVAGFIGPVGLTDKATVIYDRSLVGMDNMVCGANEAGYHYTGLCMSRDVPNASYNDVAKIYDGAPCPCCGKPLTVKKGIEIGNIFQLGTKYTSSMNMTYSDKDGSAKNPVMGCYGIGVGRLCASICQESHDDYGPIWPMSIAPWQVEICNLRADDAEVNETANELYEKLTSSGVEVLYDDRDIRPGAMFADADLFGVPIRVVVSPKTCARGAIELSTRDKSIKKDIEKAAAAEEIIALRDEMLAAFKA